MPPTSRTLTIPTMKYALGKEAFSSQAGLDAYTSSCRENDAMALLSQVKVLLSREGLTDEEWTRVLSDQLHRYVRRITK